MEQPLEHSASAGPNLDDPRERFLNRDLTWLEFNARVLAITGDARVPLLTRVRFCGIFLTNLDEFVMKRVGLHARLIHEDPGSRSTDGQRPAELLKAIGLRRRELRTILADTVEQQILPELEREGISIARYAQLPDEDRARVDEWYKASVFPILTPISVDPGQRFPFISNLSTSLAVMLEPTPGGEQVFARVKVPQVIPQIVSVQSPGAAPIPSRGVFITLTDVIANNLDDLFPGVRIADVVPFRVTRSSSIEHDDEEAEDLLEHVEEELRMRRFAEVVRLEIPSGDEQAPAVKLVMRELELDETDLSPQRGFFEPEIYSEIADLDRPEIRLTRWKPITPARLVDVPSIFDAIRQRDILLHHPYDSFESSVQRFVDEAAKDPQTLALKLTIYRTTPDSPFVRSLIRAADAGKQVACLVELRARFDEHRNVRFARQLEDAGVHVAYGVPGLKTHSKTALVIRREGGSLRGYAHLGTGNYNPSTAQLYTDLSLLTADPRITTDVIALFNAITGRAQEQEYLSLLVAPENMRDRFLALIDGEIAAVREGRPARVVGMMNALEDTTIINKLYEASGAGVPVDLFVRGFCCLRPGVSGLSENIRVTSIVGRFLEHVRMYHFASGEHEPEKGSWYIGSADWMQRNLDERVEAITPVYDEVARASLAEILRILEVDRRYAWRLTPDGSYTRLEPDAESPEDSIERMGSFETLMRRARGG